MSGQPNNSCEMASSVADQKSARLLDRSLPLPLWAQLYEDLVRRLEAKAFSGAFPGEHQLANEYDVSRHTVREALRRLRQAGILDSGRGRRTDVRTARIEQPLGALYSLFSEVQARGMHQRSEVIARRLGQDPTVANRLGIDAGTAFVYLERLRYADEQPLALDRTWLLASFARPLLDADLTATGVYAELAGLSGVRITGGQERIYAVTPTTDQRRLLGLGRGVALLAIDRIGRVNGDPVEWRETLVRGDRFSVVATWTRHTPYQMAVADGSPLGSARSGSAG
ncbi:GntR family transcriptional regulator [Micromonospora sp. NPDC047548]|uniref:GntR family transcriptional regulator n=1 Tax=Micromonospora sp. NPDC047548 TaxID=3155624 RepID=UPI0033CEFC12